MGKLAGKALAMEDNPKKLDWKDSISAKDAKLRWGR